ncbi:MAG: ribonuclease HI [Syntrophomonadaceae bacterium]|jgi:ribonuclease HI|nr:ribonuclease HI [Syntrophomonadaceae bacterium]
MIESAERVVEIYTDGACSGNPGPGGWAAVLLYQDRVKEISGSEDDTTNQRMELRAVVEGLKALNVRNWQVKVYSDSAYIVNALEKGWLRRWSQNGWLTAGKKPVANQDLWQELKRLIGLNRVKIIKVPGHRGVKWNERCDALARQAIRK